MMLRFVCVCVCVRARARVHVCGGMGICVDLAGLPHRSLADTLQSHLLSRSRSLSHSLSLPSSPVPYLTPSHAPTLILTLIR